MWGSRAEASGKSRRIWQLKSAYFCLMQIVLQTLLVVQGCTMFFNTPRQDFTFVLYMSYTYMS